jgi:cell division protein FtsQ
MRFIGAEDRSYDRRRDRRRPLPIDWRRRARFATAGAGGLAVVGLGWLMVDGWYGRQLAAIGDSLYAASASAGLNVQDVLVEGRARTQREAILATLGLSRGTPILSFDPHAAKERLETLPWVHEATVERRLPDTVYLRLSEREPLALWQYEGKLAVIDRTGQVIAGAPAAAFATLPVVVGEDAPRTAEALLRMLDSEPELRVRVAAAIRVQGRRWNIRLNDGIDIRLPESDAAAAWAELARLQREHEVLQRDVVTIDLRLPDRLVVRTAPGATLTGKRPAGEDT